MLIQNTGEEINDADYDRDNSQKYAGFQIELSRLILFVPIFKLLPIGGCYQYANEGGGINRIDTHGSQKINSPTANTISNFEDPIEHVHSFIA